MKRSQYVAYLRQAKTVADSLGVQTTQWQLGVAVFASRERPEELAQTLLKVIQACDRPALIDVMVNGNAALSESIASSTQLPEWLLETPCVVRIWHMPLASKSHAWNTYVHALAPVAPLYLFLDGYVQVEPDCMRRIGNLDRDHSNALAFSGTPAVGRSSAEMKSFYSHHGGLHGNLFALTSVCVNRLKQVEAILPLGLYGFDTVLGGMLGFGLAPEKTPWAIKRFVVSDPELTWKVPPKSPFNWRDIRTQIKRLQNNALRRLVQRATIQHMERKHRPLSDLAVTIDGYIGLWVLERRSEFLLTVVQTPLALLEVLRMRDRYSPTLAAIQPVCLKVFAGVELNPEVT